MVQRNSNAEVMSMDLSPKKPAKAYGSDGGSYYDWSPAELAMLGAASIGAAKLHLNAGGLSLPSYSDSAKVAYVLQGAGICGLVLPEAAKEKVIPVKTGDTLALPFGAVTWWHNAAEAGDTELVVLFLGDTSKGHTPGRFTNFQLTGATGIFTGFSTEFVARAWDLDQDSAASLVSTQPGTGIVKIAAGHRMPEARAEDREGMVLNCLEAPLDVDIKGGGRVVVLNTANLPLVKEVGLGADLVRIDGHSMCSPGFSCDSAYQVTYIVRGSGRVQVVGIDGTRVLETRVEAGCLFIVPRFFVVSKIADETGLEWFSIITTPNPIFSHLAGRTSVWKAISPTVLEASFNTTPEMEKMFRSKRLDSEIFFAPS
ncbi:11S globulin seed storage protein 2-like [Lolium rigidum]|uniref:11S globulin seed storage protein 2-like n=1 Tax=Lolium rigidum TaxID=89674 RepID=UPI001F5E0149|nr:11S globulin seed storage protein 2-like [Lolium rigidum]